MAIRAASARHVACLVGLAAYGLVSLPRKTRRAPSNESTPDGCAARAGEHRQERTRYVASAVEDGRGRSGGEGCAWKHRLRARPGRSLLADGGTIVGSRKWCTVGETSRISPRAPGRSLRLPSSSSWPGIGRAAKVGNGRSRRCAGQAPPAAATKCRGSRSAGARQGVPAIMRMNARARIPGQAAARQASGSGGNIPWQKAPRGTTRRQSRRLVARLVNRPLPHTLRERAVSNAVPDVRDGGHHHCFRHQGRRLGDGRRRAPRPAPKQAGCAVPTRILGRCKAMSSVLRRAAEPLMYRHTRKAERNRERQDPVPVDRLVARHQFGRISTLFEPVRQ